MSLSRPTPPEAFHKFVRKEWPTASEKDINDGIGDLNDRSRGIVQAYLEGVSATEIGQQQEPPISREKVSTIIRSAASNIALRDIVVPVASGEKSNDHQLNKLAPCTEKPDLPFETDAESVAAIKALCAVCTIQRECLKQAIDEKHTTGVWGGKTPAERRHLKLSSR